MSNMFGKASDPLNLFKGKLAKINDPLNLFGTADENKPAPAAAPVSADAAAIEADRVKREDELRRRRGAFATSAATGPIESTDQPALKPTLG